MKTLIKTLLLGSFILFTTASCEEENKNDTGKVIFYTNAQAILNCGPFDVSVFINNDSIGAISDPYIEQSQPDCLQSSSTLLLDKKVDTYTYSAKLDCNNYGEWNGTFEVISGNCILIYLDINECNLLDN